jgi:microcin C transport system substrate-binding protein
MRLDRRTRSSFRSACTCCLGAAAGPDGYRRHFGTQWRHGLSPFGNLKYPVDFKHFDYVNPQAPLAVGRDRRANSFDLLNPYT